MPRALGEKAQGEGGPGDAPGPSAPGQRAPGIAAPTGRPPRVELRALGYAGLELTVGGARLLVDPPVAVDGPVVVTWSEAERVAGARASTGPLAAAAGLVPWLGRPGVALGEAPVDFAGFTLRARPYPPIPYATPPEALRKTASALRRPLRALRRVAFTLGRPAAGPQVVVVERGGERVVLLGQALHRFVPAAEVEAWAAWAGPATLVVAGTDFEDEAAAGAGLARFAAERRVVADLVGDIRRELGLPMRPLEVALAAAPPGTLALSPGGRIQVTSAA